MASDLALAARQDPKAKLVWIFVGAVLLPSAALSVVSFNSIPKQAEATKITLRKRADRVLMYVEEDLERLAQGEAQEAARLVGWETLVEGRPEAVKAALRPSGMGDAFDTLKLEASSHISKMARPHDDRK